jgi:hypothetical protein
MSGKRWFGIAAALSLFISHTAMAGLARAGDEKDVTASHAVAGPTANAGSGPAGAAAAAPSRPPAADSNAAIAVELQELKSEVEAQRAALEAQQRRIADLEAQIHPDAADAAAAPNAALAAPPEGGGSAGRAVPGESGVEMQPLATNLAAAIRPVAPQTGGTERAENVASHPLSFKIGSAEFTPGGWADITGIFRSTDIGSGTGTTFQSIPFNNTLPQGALSEFRLTAQTSRISMKVDAPITEATRVTGYFESDFNGFQPPNAYISTNSGTFRLRLFWADVRHDKWEVLAGQSWSLLTPNRAGLSPMPADIFSTARLDTNYVAGLTYARQAGFRVIYHATDWWTLGVALENPQQYVPASVVFPGAPGYFAGQFDNGSGATNGSGAATNPAVPNLHPDVIVKSAEDWKIGSRALHVEEAGLARSFKVQNNLVAPNATNTLTGGGAALNANLELFPNFHVILDSFWSDGGGRYIGGLGPDVIVKANGALSAVHAGSGLGGLEYQVTPSFLFDAYYSGAYFSRDTSLLASAASPTPSCDGATGFTCVGYGFAGSANSNNRAIQEATFGFTKTFWSNPNAGKLQFISQSSYATRAPWYVAVGAPKDAHAFIQYVDLRYVLP